mmetsp:Transcript_26199/g.46754  ORF Transcript_26199/g.46754 Transcript_26199/m.46754 type:complete len:873 (+) Transcript_26199:2500-5118(+)
MNERDPPKVKLLTSSEEFQDLSNVLKSYIDCVFERVEECSKFITFMNPEGLLEPSTSPIKVLESGMRKDLWKNFEGQETLIRILMAAMANIKYGTEEMANSRTFQTVKKKTTQAEMDFKRRLVLWNFYQGSEEYIGELEPGSVFYNILHKYITKYYELPDTADEVALYLRLLNGTHLHPLSSTLERFMSSVIDRSTNRLRMMRCVICVGKILRMLGAYSTPFYRSVDSIWYVQDRYFNRYVEFLPHEALTKDDRGRSVDEIVLLCVELIMQDFSQLAVQDAGPWEDTTMPDDDLCFMNRRVMHCIGLLEYALSKSPYNIQIKTRLIELYMSCYAVLPAEKLYKSLQLSPAEVRTRGFIAYRIWNDIGIYNDELHDLCSLVLKQNEIKLEEMLNEYTEQYFALNTPKMIEIEVKRKELQQSYFLVICKFSIAVSKFYKKVCHSNSTALKTLRENLHIINTCAYLDDIINFTVPVDLKALFVCGVVPLTKLKTEGIMHNRMEIEMEGDYYQKSEKLKRIFGKYTNSDEVQIKALTLKLLLNISENSQDAIELDLKELNYLYDKADLLAKNLSETTFKRAYVQQEESKLSTKEGSRRINLENRAIGEYIYSGEFSSRKALLDHLHLLKSSCAKFNLLLFEGSYRLMHGHIGKEEDESPSRLAHREGIEGELLDRLTTWDHIAKHIEVLGYLYSDIVGLIVPRENYLMSLRLKDNLNPEDAFEAKHEEFNPPLHPDMLQPVIDFIQGPVIYALTVQSLWLKLIPSESAKANPRQKIREDQQLEQVRNAMRGFFTTIYSSIPEMQRYLSSQVPLSYAAKHWATLSSNESFIQRSLQGEIGPALFETAVQQIIESHTHLIRMAVQQVIACNRITRSFA